MRTGSEPVHANAAKTAFSEASVSIFHNLLGLVAKEQ